MRLIGPLQMAGDALEAPKGRVGERLILATQPLIGGGPVTERRPALQVLEPMAPEAGDCQHAVDMHGSYARGLSGASSTEDHCRISSATTLLQVPVVDIRESSLLVACRARDGGVGRLSGGTRP